MIHKVFPHEPRSEAVGNSGEVSMEGEQDTPLACSDCFVNAGLRLDAERGGISDASECPRCSSQAGRKLTRRLLETLAYRFFVRGTFQRCEYGAAPRVQFNDQRQTEIAIPSWLAADTKLFEKLLGIGFFYYGPRLWMVGEVEPLKLLQAESTRDSLVQRILSEYPTTEIASDQSIYRLRKNPSDSTDPSQFDTPPSQFLGTGRLDRADVPVMYASQDVEVCIHECRVTAEDELFLATFVPKRTLRLLDLTALLAKEDETEFESLDMAVHMLFLAASHSYEISREIAFAASRNGFDGIIYPSYFSLLRTGGMPFETVYGISHRQIATFSDHEKSKTVPNLALFGRPLAEGLLELRSVNRLVLERVTYEYYFGPVGQDFSSQNPQLVAVTKRLRFARSLSAGLQKILKRFQRWDSARTP